MHCVLVTMFHRDWLTKCIPFGFAFVIGALIVAAAYERFNIASQNPSPRLQPDRYLEQAEQRILLECADLGATASARCASEIRSAAEQSDMAAQDLEQQTRMAQWAFWMMIASFGSIFVTAVGVVYVRLTLDQTIAATKAANSAVAVTGRIGEAQVRAYIGLETVEVGYVRAVGQPVKNIRIRPYLINTGQSPAFLTTIVTDIRILWESVDTFQIDRRQIRSSTLRVGANKTVFLSPQFISWADAKKAVDEDKAIVLCIFIEYLDVFGNPPIIDKYTVRIVFNGNLIDPDMVEQPSIEWIDYPMAVHIPDAEQ